MKNLSPIFAADFYKTGHIKQYKPGTVEVYSNLTPRSSKHSNTYLDYIVWFGLQYVLHKLNDMWRNDFFKKTEREVIDNVEFLNKCLGDSNAVGPETFLQLHRYQFLPLEIKALPEGSRVPYGVPVLTIRNTQPKFFWLTNFIETWLSAELWKACTSATTAHAFKLNFLKHARETGYDESFTWFQGHDFSYRGMSNTEDAALSGAGHLLSFYGTDTIPAIILLREHYYGYKSEIIGTSVPATEHSVMSSYGPNHELELFKRLITEVYPNGIVSIVSDTWDFWRVLTEYAVELKDDIMKRNGRVVFRPDSGNPYFILCGDDVSTRRCIEEGAYDTLYREYPGEDTKNGFATLDTHVGLIYGDSITLDIQQDILDRLEQKGFAANNLVLGIGSYTYQYTTRDAHGFAIKATHIINNGEHIPIFKDPKTDEGLKKSAKGYLRVELENGKYVLHDNQRKEEEQQGELRTVYLDGVIYDRESLNSIRLRLNEGI